MHWLISKETVVYNSCTTFKYFMGETGAISIRPNYFEVRNMEEHIDEELKALRMKRLQQLISEDSLIKEKADWPGSPLKVTDANMQEFIKQYRLVVVDCWAPWCGPCKSLAPVFESLAQDYQGKIVFGKLNVDENQKTAMTYETMSIPTLLVFKDGKMVDRIVGALPKPMIVQKLQVYLNSGE